MHHTKAGKQIIVSGIAIPSQGIKNIIENIAVSANNEASIPIVLSDWLFLRVNPSMYSAITRSTKNNVEKMTCIVYIVSGKIPIPIRAIELRFRRYAPVLFLNVLINPSENTNASIPPIIMPELKNIADIPLIPRSLIACSVQLNHGECDSANPMQIKTTIGNNIPHIPEILVILTFFSYKFNFIHIKS